MERRGRTISAVVVEANDAGALRGRRFHAGLDILGQRVKGHNSSRKRRLYTKLCFDGTNSLQLLRKIVSIHRKLYRLHRGKVQAG